MPVLYTEGSRYARNNKQQQTSLSHGCMSFSEGHLSFFAEGEKGIYLTIPIKL